jgi:hypothetical protein
LPPAADHSAAALRERTLARGRWHAMWACRGNLAGNIHWH